MIFFISLCMDSCYAVHGWYPPDNSGRLSSHSPPHKYVEQLCEESFRNPRTPHYCHLCCLDYSHFLLLWWKQSLNFTYSHTIFYYDLILRFTMVMLQPLYIARRPLFSHILPDAASASVVSFSSPPASPDASSSARQFPDNNDKIRIRWMRVAAETTSFNITVKIDWRQYHGNMTRLLFHLTPWGHDFEE